NEHIQAVALIVLAAIRIARPKHQQERLVAILKHRQDHARGDGREIFLLRDVGGERAGCGYISSPTVSSARWRNGREFRCLKAIDNFGRERDALRGASSVVDEYSLLTGAFSRIKN